MVITYPPEQAVIRYDSGGVQRANLFQWDKKRFTDPKSWKINSSFRFIVHAIVSPRDFLSDPSLFSRGGKVLTRWDTLSTSLISDEKQFTYGSFGVVLKVPFQNILITHHSDMMFPNNIGDIRRQRFEHMNKTINQSNLSCFIRSGLLSNEIMDLTANMALDRQKKD